MDCASLSFHEAVVFAQVLEKREDFQSLTEQMNISSIHLQKESKYINLLMNLFLLCLLLQYYNLYKVSQSPFVIVLSICSSSLL